MTDITLTDEELGLIRRVLQFAAHDVPIQDALGNKIFPTPDTRKLSYELDKRLEAADIKVPGQLFTAYDPDSLTTKKITLRWYAENEVEYNVSGRVRAVRTDTETDPTSYVVVLADGSEYPYHSREDLQANSRVELEQD